MLENPSENVESSVEPKKPKLGVREETSSDDTCKEVVGYGCTSAEELDSAPPGDL